MKLAGQVVLITGAGRGIGRVTAHVMARERARLVLCSRTESDLKRVAGEVSEKGAEVLTVVADVSQEADVEKLIDATMKKFGRLDVVVNNAGQYRLKKGVVDMDVSEWDNLIAVNLRGPFLISKYSLPHMIKQNSGSIVMVASTSGKRANADSSAYAASKFGLNGLAQALLYEVRQYNIRVVVVSPSLVDCREPDRPLKEIGKGAHLRMEDVAESILHVVTLPGRALVRDIELWATNP